MSERRPGLLIAAGSVAGTALIVALVFSLAGWAYRQRGSTLHDGRLQRAVAQHPTSAQISSALLAEAGTRAVPVPASDEELRRLLTRWPEARADDILAKRRRWPVLRIFAVGDLAYFLFFDGDDTLQDYALGR